jgi:hypothetical protein
VLALCVVLGVLSTVGIAWFHAATQDMFGEDRLLRLRRPQGVTDGPDMIWIRQATHHASIGWTVSYELGIARTFEPVDSEGQALTVPSWGRHIVYPWESEPDRWPAFVPPGVPYAIQAVNLRAYGWPSPALYCMQVVKDTGAPPFAWTSEGGLLIPWMRSPDYIQAPPPLLLPLRVIARGVAIDVACHSVGWMAIVLAVPFIRAERRRRRGLCVACGYDVYSIPVEHPCPECGCERTTGHSFTSAT